MIRLALILVFGFSTTSCGKGGIVNPFGSDDPLYGKPDFIRNAGPGNQKPGPGTLREEEIIISSNQSSFIFQEDVSTEIKISGRVLRPDYNLKLVIENMDEFPGASFDAATGAFTYLPKIGSVPESAANGLETLLKVQAIAVGVDGSNTVKNKSFNVLIRRASLQPTVVKDDLAVNYIREGERTRFTVSVSYRGEPGQVKNPDLRVNIDPPKTSYDSDLSKYITLEGNPVQDANDPKIWNYTFEINLYNVNLTKSSEDYAFQISFQNSQALSSTPREFTVNVRTNLEEIRSTIEYDTVRVTKGTTFVRDVVFYDPRDEGLVLVELTGPTPLPEGMTIDRCREGSRDSIRICTIVWAVPTTLNESYFTLRFEATSRSQAYGDNFSISRNFSLDFQVEP